MTISSSQHLGFVVELLDELLNALDVSRRAAALGGLRERRPRAPRARVDAEGSERDGLERLLLRAHYALERRVAAAVGLRVLVVRRGHAVLHRFRRDDSVGDGEDCGRRDARDDDAAVGLARDLELAV